MNGPILIAGFADQNGATAASTVGYLVERWNANLLADFDPEDLFDFTVRRPLIRRESDQRVLEWPTSRLYTARPPGASRDVVLLTGIEPQLRWRTFCDEVVSFIRELGVTASLTLASHPSGTPHTRPVPLLLSASDEEFGRTFGLEPIKSYYEGPTGITGVLNVHLAKECPTASLSTRTPFYVPTEQHPGAMVALIEAIDRGLGTTTPVSTLRDAEVTFDAEAQRLVMQSPPLEAAVRSMEQHFDETRGSVVTPVPAGTTEPALPSSDVVIAGLEQLLREKRESKGYGDGARSADN